MSGWEAAGAGAWNGYGRNWDGDGWRSTTEAAVASGAAGTEAAVASGAEPGAEKTSTCRSLRGGPAIVQTPESRVNRNFRTLVAEGAPVDILGICDRAGKQLNMINVAAALQAIARAEDGPAVVAGDSRFDALVELAMDLLVAPQELPDEVPTKELAVTAWSLARLPCGPHLSSLAPVVAHSASQGQFSTQELTSTSWAFAKREVRDRPLLTALASESLSRLSEFTGREIAATAWSSAKLQMQDPTLLESLAAAAISKLSEFANLDLVNTPWACAKLEFQHPELSQAISEDVIARLADWGPQEIANMAWSLAKSLVENAPLRTAIAAAALPNISDAAPQDLTFTSWACAKLRYEDPPLLDALAAQSSATISEFNSQQLANTVWAFAKLKILNRTLLKALSSEALPKLTFFQTQELSMTAWSFATLSIVVLPLMEAISSEAIARISEFSAQDISNMSWSYSTLNLLDDELIDAISSESSKRISAYSAKELAATAWSMATLLVGDGEERLDFLNGLAENVLHSIDELTPQELSQIAWAFAKMNLWHKPLLDSLAEASISRLAHFEAVHLRNLAWSFATLLMRNTTLLDAISSQAIAKISDFSNQQHIANTAWAFAKLHIVDVPLCEALSSAALPPITEFTPQGLSNTAWAFARLTIQAMPLISAISAEAISRRSEICVQNLSSIAWAFSALSYRDRPFLEAISSEVLNNGVLPDKAGSAAGPGAQSLLWSLWSSEGGDIMQQVASQWSKQGVVPCVLELGLLEMEGAWRKDSAAETEVLLTLMRTLPVRLARIALYKTAMPPKARPAEPPSSPPVSDVLGLTETECKGYFKLARFVQYLDLTGLDRHAAESSPLDIAEAIERFPLDVGKWLKVAAGDKARVIWDSIRGRKNKPHEIALEFGTLVGYTAIRMGAACGRQVRDHPAREHCVDVVTIELDPVHACIARHVVDQAGLSGTVEVWTGQVKDVVPRVVEEMGGRSVGFLFMDQRGTAFHEDIQQMERMKAFGVSASVVADNCLKPGAPFYVWRAARSGRFRTTIWSLTEFAREDVEDWLVVSGYTGPGAEEMQCEEDVQKALALLAWETGNFGAGAESGALQADDWVAFSQYVRQYFKRLGIEATPWQGSPESKDSSDWDRPLSTAELFKKFEAEAAEMQQGEAEERGSGE